MKKVTLAIENHNESKTVELDGELSIGRTDAARLILDDAGLSRVNTTFFRDGDEVFIVDENSTNGTFVNSEKISGNPRLLNDRDEINIGSHTNIYVEIFGEKSRQTNPPPAISNPPPIVHPTAQSPNLPESPKSVPPILIVAGVLFFVIIFGTLAAFLLINPGNDDAANTDKPTPPPIRSGLLIPVRVLDPLGNEEPEELDDIIASWEGTEDSLDTNTVDAVKATTASGGSKESDLNVPIEDWIKQKNLAFAPRSAATGLDPGLKFFPELVGGNVIKQKNKLAELIKLGYKQPMDFSDLAEKRIKGELIELPIATSWYFLDVGGSASEDAFKAFSFEMDSTPIAPGSSKYAPLEQLAKNFAGQKYDINNGRDRRQMRIRLLRMFHPKAKPVLEELAKAYFQKFGRPLRVTSLTRSMDYQIGLNNTNANSFKVRGAGSLPPHTSGCAFDLARKHMTAEEQNFVQEKLAEMENRGIIDALREGGVNACFHVFIYPDGRPPK